MASRDTNPRGGNVPVARKLNPKPHKTPKINPSAKTARCRNQISTFLGVSPDVLADQKIRQIGQFYVPPVCRTIYSRCDLHPRWRPDGKMIGFNSVHEGYRQVYVMDVK